MHSLRCESVQADEIWTYTYKKEKRVTLDDPRDYGDTYVFVAMDRKTKVVPCFAVGKRSEETTEQFVSDLSRRIDGNVQVFTDGYSHYKWSIPRYFGARADFAQVIKNYGEDADEHRYSPSRIRSIDHVWIQGFPDAALVSTSHIERQNLTMRMQMRRFTRLTNAFSKKLANLRAAVALHFAWYNFVRIHRTLRMAPAMAAGIAGGRMTIEQLVP
jgi:IS1 family transposase